MKILACVLPVFVILGVHSQELEPGEICLGNCTVDASGTRACYFTSIIDHFASEWGYYSFAECGNQTNPTIGLEGGTTYYFDQTDRSNWYNPIGFSYFPDGLHDEVDELDPVIPPPGTASPCNQDATCPAPMYMINDAYLGTYSNNAMITPVTNNRDDHGLELYKSPFFLPISEWSASTYVASLYLDVGVKHLTDIFYFSHNHNYMSGRIKVMISGLNVTDQPKPAIEYDYVARDDFDTNCGTTDISDTQLPQQHCPETFVCNVPEGNDELQEYANCYNSMNCKMKLEMTTKTSAKSEVALFIHQMIPHHQNAINMAKTLMQSGYLQCDDPGDAESEDCVMEQLLFDIIAKQNRQIQDMQQVLDNKNYPATDICDLSDYAPKSDVDETDDEAGAGAGLSVKALSLFVSTITFMALLI